MVPFVLVHLQSVILSHPRMYIVYYIYIYVWYATKSSCHSFSLSSVPPTVAHHLLQSDKCMVVFEYQNLLLENNNNNNNKRFSHITEMY